MKKFVIFLLICLLIGVGVYLQLTQNIFVYQLTSDGTMIAVELDMGDLAEISNTYHENYAISKGIDMKNLNLKDGLSFFFDANSQYLKDSLKGKVCEDLFYIGSCFTESFIILGPALFFAFLDMFIKKINIFTILKALFGVVMLIGVGFMIYSRIVLPEYIDSIIESGDKMGMNVQVDYKFTLSAYLVIATTLLSSLLLIIPVKKAKAK